MTSLPASFNVTTDVLASLLAAPEEKGTPGSSRRNAILGLVPDLPAVLSLSREARGDASSLLSPSPASSAIQLFRPTPPSTVTADCLGPGTAPGARLLSTSVSTSSREPARFES
ncbi:Hypothetical predicted protein, partial [Pelobates cultripes]